MRRHVDFWSVTAEALDTAMRVHKLDDEALREKLMQAYLSLAAYPEVKEVLRRLKSLGVRTAILSNGSPTMLEAAVRSAGLDGLFDFVWSVESVGIFKPDASVYQLAENDLRLPRARIWFQSSNVWDAAAAGAYGFRIVWCNRARQPMEYGWAFSPTEVEDLAALPALLEKVP
jgi:2-haloacid dehalogenase